MLHLHYYVYSLLIHTLEKIFFERSHIKIFFWESKNQYQETWVEDEIVIDAVDFVVLLIQYSALTIAVVESR